MPPMTEESTREPHPTELPGHDAGTAASDAHATVTVDHAGAAGHGEHDHDAVPLGPIDVIAWGAGLLGVGLGVVIALAFAAATGAT
jgi:hypothetical protein